jgi:hypothetical protein
MRKPCATTCIEEKVNVRIDFLTRQDMQPEKARRKRRNFRLNGRMRNGVLNYPGSKLQGIESAEIKQINTGIYSWKSAGQTFHL